MNAFCEETTVCHIFTVSGSAILNWEWYFQNTTKLSVFADYRNKSVWNRDQWCYKVTGGLLTSEDSLSVYKPDRRKLFFLCRQRSTSERFLLSCRLPFIRQHSSFMILSDFYHHAGMYFILPSFYSTEGFWHNAFTNVCYYCLGYSTNALIYCLLSSGVTEIIKKRQFYYR